MNFRTSTLILALSLSGASLAAQDARLKIPDFKSLEHKAIDSVNITLGPWLLHTVAMVLDDDKDPDSAAAKKLLAGITSIQVRSFQFDRDFAYSEADIDAVRDQLSAPGWTPLMKVRNRKDGENVDICVLVDNNKTRGFALVASQPREFTIVNIVGSINLEDIPKLGRHLHLPNKSIDDGLSDRLAAVPQL
jgi:hypothetical protein